MRAGELLAAGGEGAGRVGVLRRAKGARLWMRRLFGGDLIRELAARYGRAAGQPRAAVPT
jgi:hypothetical protein